MVKYEYNNTVYLNFFIIKTVFSSTYSLSFTCVCPVCDHPSSSSFPLSGFTPSGVPDRLKRVAGQSAAWGFFRLRLLPCCWPWEIDFMAQAGPRDPSSILLSTSLSSDPLHYAGHGAALSQAACTKANVLPFCQAKGQLLTCFDHC